jgi:hypothetical protein
VGRLFTLGKAAIELRCAEHHLRKLCDRNCIPYQRAGRYRLLAFADFPTIRSALVEAGFIQVTEVVGGVHE